MRGARCDRTWQVDLAREGRLPPADAQSFDVHRQRCAACDAQFRSDERLADLARALPAPAVDEVAVRKLWNRVLRDRAHAGAPRRRSPTTTVAIAIAAVAVATIAAAASAYAVSAQRRDAEVAAASAGTAAGAGAGRARGLALIDEDEASLGAAAVRPPEAAPAACVATPPVGGARPPESPEPARARRAVVPGDDRELDAYEAAVAAYRAGAYDDAAAKLHRFTTAYPSSELASDASFLEAASLARAGRADAAGLAAEHHLERYPRSFHKKEASVLVARAARDRGDCDEARRALAPWATEADMAANLGRCASGSP